MVTRTNRMCGQSGPLNVITPFMVGQGEARDEDEGTKEVASVKQKELWLTAWILPTQHAPFHPRNGCGCMDIMTLSTSIMSMCMPWEGDKVKVWEGLPQDRAEVTPCLTIFPCNQSRHSNKPTASSARLRPTFMLATTWLNWMSEPMPERK